VHPPSRSRLCLSVRRLVYVVKERLGHASITTTEQYLHIVALPDADDSAVKGILCHPPSARAPNVTLVNLNGACERAPIAVLPCHTARLVSIVLRSVVRLRASHLTRESAKVT
jgi:hypothetical protein